MSDDEKLVREMKGDEAERAKVLAAKKYLDELLATNGTTQQVTHYAMGVVLFALENEAELVRGSEWESRKDKTKLLQAPLKLFKRLTFLEQEAWVKKGVVAETLLTQIENQIEDEEET